MKASGGNSGTQIFYFLFFYFNAGTHQAIPEREDAYCCLCLVFCIGNADSIYIHIQARVRFLAQRASCELQRVSAALRGHGWPRPLLLGRLQRGVPGVRVHKGSLNISSDWFGPINEG